MAPFASGQLAEGSKAQFTMLDAEHVGMLRGLVDRLELAPADQQRKHCWSVEDGPDPESLLFLTLSDSVDDAMFVVGGGFVVHGRRTLKTSSEFLAGLGRIAEALPPEELPRRPQRCNPITLGRFPECECGVPEDFADWADMSVCAANSCLNYAVRDRWCNGSPIADLPKPDNALDREAWIRILAADGLAHSPAFPDPPADQPAGGWHVALSALDLGNEIRFHFLRLDGERWVHKFGPRPPQSCDAGGAPIPKFGAEGAELCGYLHVAYFWVPRPLLLNR
jgi:hypothetical protein